jgi:hypothetical protein
MYTTQHCIIVQLLSLLFCTCHMDAMCAHVPVTWAMCSDEVRSQCIEV